MRRIGTSFLGLAAASLGLIAAPAQSQASSGTFFVGEYRGLLGSRHPHPGYRSKRKAPRRVPKANRLTISRRVRRKHRRSKAA